MHKTVSSVTINEIEEVSCTVKLLQKALLNVELNICKISNINTAYAHNFINEVQYWLNDVGANRYLKNK